MKIRHKSILCKFSKILLRPAPPPRIPYVAYSLKCSSVPNSYSDYFYWNLIINRKFILSERKKWSSSSWLKLSKYTYYVWKLSTSNYKIILQVLLLFENLSCFVTPQKGCLKIKKRLTRRFSFSWQNFPKYVLSDRVLFKTTRNLSVKCQIFINFCAKDLKSSKLRCVPL